MPRLTLAVALLATACAGAPSTVADEEVSQEDAARQASVGTAMADSVEILVDEQGMTLYVFDVDPPGASACYNACARLWPPLLTEGPARAVGDADPSLLGTIARDDGTTQVTYDGRPLYYYAQDTRAGDTRGQGVEGVWWMVAPSGEAITDTSAESAESEEPAAPGYGYP